MGFLKQLRQRTMAAVYRPLISRHNRFIASYKTDLFRQVQGRVLEIGPGPAGNLKFMGDVESWVGIEPNPYMHRFVKQQLAETGLRGDVIAHPAEQLPFEDNSFDFAVSTLVLCSVLQPRRVLHEILRVLRPGGRFLFIEHVAAPRGSRLRSVQNFVVPVYRFCGDGCYPNRETGTTIQQSGFSTVEFQEFRAPASALPVVVSPHIAGFAEAKSK
jgi:ubiquinone/menaquinone biosynthesis C-methylase UbiE